MTSKHFMPLPLFLYNGILTFAQTKPEKVTDKEPSCL